jgi:gamma-glutamyl:cysteine ligase YbdK (ATP-grasp superfamily)
MEELYSKLEAIAKKHGVYDSVNTLERAVRARMEKQQFWQMGTAYEQNPVAAK